MFTEQTTLCPAQADDAMHGITANYITPPPFTAPLKSRATRKIPLRSTASCRGSIVTRLNGVMITLHFESLLELMVILLLTTRGDVVEIWDQPPAITYYTPDGKQKTHNYDLLASLNDGRKIAIAVKYEERASEAAFQADMSRIAQATPKKFADDVVVMSEADFTRAQAINAARYFEFNKHPDAAADIAVKAVISEQHGAVSMKSIVEQTELGNRAYRATVKAVFANILKLQQPGVITPRSIVLPTRKGGLL